MKIEPLATLTVQDREDRVRSFLFKGSTVDIWGLIKQERFNNEV